MMISARHWKLGPGLLFLVSTLAVSVAFVLFGARSLVTRRKDAERLAEIQSRNLAHSIETNIFSALKRIDFALDTVVGELEREGESGGLDLPRLRRFLATEERSLPEAGAIRVTDGQGRVFLGNTGGDPLASYAGRPYFSALRDHPGSGMVVSKPLMGLFTKRWVVPCAKRYVLPDGRFGGMVVIPVFVEQFQTILSGFEIGPGGTLTLRDGDGGFITRYPEPRNGPVLHVGDLGGSAELHEFVRSGQAEETHFARTPFDQVSRTYTTCRIRQAPLMIGAGLAEEDYLAQWRRDRTRTVGLMGASLAGLWILVGLLWKAWGSHLRDTRALQTSEERFRAYIDHSTDVLFTLDATGVFTFISPAWEWHFGCPVSSALGKPYVSFIHSEDAGAFDEYVRRVLTTGQSETSPPYRVRHADGSWRWRSANGARIAAQDAGPRFMGVAHDITESKHAETALRDSQARLQRAESVARIGNWELDLAGREIRGSEGARLIYGLPGEKWSLGDVQGMVLPEYRGILDAALKDLIERQQPYDVEFQIRRNGDGLVRHIQSKAEYDPHRHTIFGVICDLTELKQAEAEQANLHGQLQRAQRMESLGILAGGIAHDMNNVLGAILGLASAHLETHAPEGSVYHAFDTISKAAVRGGDMVKRLLSFSRQSPVEPQGLDMNSVLLEVVHILERTTLSKVILEMDLAEGPLPLLGDASALTHALMNLCVNAVDAMPARGTLTLRTRLLEGRIIEVQVEDTGIGMSREVLDRALDPFFTTKEVGKGTGLGLSLVYSTVNSHQGQLEIHSQPGHGTTVKLRFPAMAGSSRTVEAADQRRSLLTQNSLNVLLVDDDELIQDSTRAVLEALGHRTTTLSRGEEALQHLESGNQADVVILDLNMPGLGGVGTLKGLKALRPDLPVLLATGRVNQAALDLVGAHSQVALLAKPYSMKELQQKLAWLLRV